MFHIIKPITVGKKIFRFFTNHSRDKTKTIYFYIFDNKSNIKMYDFYYTYISFDRINNNFNYKDYKKKKIIEYINKLIKMEKKLYIEDTQLINYSIIYNFSYIIIIDKYSNTIRRMLNNKCSIKDHIKNKTNNININYFLYCLIYNLFIDLIHINGYYGGGGIRDLFLNKNKLNYDCKIDLDIYLTNKKFFCVHNDDIINPTKDIEQKNICYSNSIHYLLINLAKICDVSIKIISINTINRIEDDFINTDRSRFLYAITYQHIYKLNDITLSIDINRLRKFKFCITSPISLNYNIDYEQNGLILKKKYINIFDFILELQHIRKCENLNDKNIIIKKNIQKKFKLHQYIISCINNIRIKEVLNKIFDFLGNDYLYILCIINDIINNEMTTSHMLCCNQLNCNFENFSKKLNDYQRCDCKHCFLTLYCAYKRNKKFINRGFKIIDNKCSHKFCVYEAIKNPNIIPCLETLTDIYIKKKYVFISLELFMNNYCIETNLDKSSIYCTHYKRMIKSNEQNITYNLSYNNIQVNFLHNSIKSHYKETLPANYFFDSRNLFSKDDNNIHESILLSKNNKTTNIKLTKNEYINDLRLHKSKICKYARL
jgi:hypothetical protein